HEFRKTKTASRRSETPSARRGWLRRGGRDLGLRFHADLVATLVVVLELHHAVHQGKDRVVRSHADVAAWVPLRSVLAHDDVAGDHLFAAEFLDALVFRIRVATVAR